MVGRHCLSDAATDVDQTWGLNRKILWIQLASSCGCGLPGLPSSFSIPVLHLDSAGKNHGKPGTFHPTLGISEPCLFCHQ